MNGIYVVVVIIYITKINIFFLKKSHSLWVFQIFFFFEYRVDYMCTHMVIIFYFVGMIHRMAMILRRSRLVKQIQEQHAELMELTATMELQQLRTYPTLNVPIYQQDL